LCSGINIILLFSIQIVLLLFFELGQQLDVYYAANSIHTFSIALLSGIISSTVTPLLVRVVGDDLYKLKLLFSSLLWLTVIFLSLTTFIQLVFSNKIANYLFPVLVDDSNIDIGFLISIFAIASFFNVLTFLFTSLNFCFGHYLNPIISQAVGITFQIILIYLSADKITIELVSCYFLISQLIIFILTSHRYIIYVVFRIKLSRNIKLLFNDVKYLSVGAAASKSDILIDRILLSSVGAGVLSAFNYGQLIINTALGVVSKAVSITSLVELSGFNDRGIEQRYIVEKLEFYILIIIISMAFYVVFGYALLNNTIKFLEPYKVVIEISLLLVGVCIGGTLSAITTNAYYAFKRTKQLVFLSLSVNSLFLVTKVLLFYEFGFFVIPILLSLKSLVNFYLGLVFLEKYIGGAKLVSRGLLLFLFMALSITFLLSKFIPNTYTYIGSVIAWSAIIFYYRGRMFGNYYDKQNS